jgi:hypothetical protein
MTDLDAPELYTLRVNVREGSAEDMNGKVSDAKERASSESNCESTSKTLTSAHRSSTRRPMSTLTGEYGLHNRLKSP